MQACRVADADDPRVALYRGVRDPELLGRDVFIAEGRLVVRRLVERSPFRARSVLVTPAALDALHDLVVPPSVEVLLVEQRVMDATTGFNIHRGCLALAERETRIPLERLLATPGPLVVLENVGNPDNVGGVFRNAAAFGASGVVLSPGCADPLYRKAIRTSMGTSLSVPFVTDAPWPSALDALTDGGWSTVAMSTGGDQLMADVAPRLAGCRTALLLGHEGDGLSAEALTRASVHARIPMASGVDSLNVATAAGVALYAIQP